MTKLKMGLGALLAIAIGSFAFAQQGAFPNYPIVGGAAYCASTNNGVCVSTIPAGPTILTGYEQLPANTELYGGRSPQNVLVTPASLNANPVTISAANLTSNFISASNIQGGLFLTGASTIAHAAVTLPSAPINGQQYVISANRTITVLGVTAASGDSMGGNSAPTVMTASLTAPQGYRFICSLSAGVCTWYRLQ